MSSKKQCKTCRHTITIGPTLFCVIDPPKTIVSPLPGGDPGVTSGQGTLQLTMPLWRCSRWKGVPWWTRLFSRN